MKKTLFILMALVLSAFIIQPAFADRGDRRDDHPSRYQDRDQNRRPSDRDQDRRPSVRNQDRRPSPRMDRERRDDRNRGGDRFDRDRNRDHDRDYDYRTPAHRPYGYRPQPHGRFLGPSRFGRPHSYHYDGHWNSWDHWDRYRREHSDRYRYGHYYRENGHLFFGFCDPTGGSCFYFSIGR